jgi:hypothetical protein
MSETEKKLSHDNLVKFWEKWHEATYGKRVDQYMTFWGWRDVAFAFAEAYASSCLAEVSREAEDFEQDAMP